MILSEEQTDTEGIIMELSAGVGGQEAMLFCKELSDMYMNYCDSQGWGYEVVQNDKSDLEGVRHLSVNIDHPGKF